MPASLPHQLLHYFSLAGILLLLSPAARAQTNPTPTPMPNALPPQPPGANLLDGDKVYNYVAKMPAYLDGGIEGLQSFMASHVRGAQSGPTAFVTFIVDKEGKLRRPAFGRAAAPSEAEVAPELAEAFRSAGPFRAGRQNGQAVNVTLTVPTVQRGK